MFVYKDFGTEIHKNIPLPPHMRAIVLLVALFCLPLIARGTFTRQDGIDCILRYVDGLTPEKDADGVWRYVYGEKDGCVDNDEITYAKAAFLTPLQQFIAQLEKNAKIMHNCNADAEQEIAQGREACISREDMVASNKTCIATQARLDKLNKYICKPAAAHALGKHS